MSNEEINKLVAEKVMGWAVVRDIRFWDHSNNNGRPCFVQYAEGRWGVVRQSGSTYEPWSPSTDIAADYSVLVKVRETWSVEMQQRFAEMLDEIWTARGSTGHHWVPENAVAYQPGDYSLAALKAHGIEVTP